MLSRNLITIAILLLLLTVSALAVIFNGYQHRQLFIGLQNLQEQESKLKVQFGRLLLEESAWSSPALIEQLAVSKLSMVVPKAGHLIVTARKDSAFELASLASIEGGGVAKDSGLIAANNLSDESASR